MADDLTATAVRRLLCYDPATGEFVRVSTGKVTGYREARGYLIVGIGKKTYKAHRLAWLYVHGRWPTQIDHIDGDTGNNRIANLREATGSLNNANTRRPRHNRSGYKGVHFNNKTRKWHAAIKKDRRRYFLGVHETPEAAYAAYVRKATELFGEFARVA